MKQPDWFPIKDTGDGWYTPWSFFLSVTLPAILTVLALATILVFLT